MRETFRIGDTEHALWLSSSDAGLSVHLETQKIDADIDRTGGVRIRVNGVAHEIFLVARDDRIYVHADGQAHEIVYLDPVLRHAGDDSVSRSDHLRAPMPGAVVTCPVKAGDAVEPGDLLMVIESMKLETPFKAWRAGLIETIRFTVGQTFDRDAVLLSMMPGEAS